MSVTPPHPTRRSPLWLTLQYLMRHIFLVGLRYRARGHTHVPPSGGGLLLINHQSFLDPMLVGLPLRRPVSYLARDSLFPVPGVGWVLRNTHVMPINRDAASTASIRTALERLEQGFLVGVFPEGTRSATGEVDEFRPGFISLLRRTNVPVYPVGIAGAHEAMPRSSLWMNFRPVRVVFGPPIHRSDLGSLCDRGREVELTEYLRQAVLHCQTEAEEWRREALTPDRKTMRAEAQSGDGISQRSATESSN